MKKLSVTIAIPAYNEEENIVSLLSSIEKQVANSYIVDRIFVYSDGSSDNTVKIIREKFKEVKVFDFKENIGKNRRLNQIFKNNKSDVLIQVDADIHIEDKNVIENLIRPFLEHKNLGISCAYQLSHEPKTFIGKMSYFGFKIWDDARNSLGDKGIRYYCEGGLRAFSRDFSKIFTLPIGRHVGEDVYSFYFAVEYNFDVVVCKNAKFYQDLAWNYWDYKKQMKRFLLDPFMVTNEFDKKLVDKYEVLSFDAKFKSFLKKWIKDPITGSIYILLQLDIYIEKMFYRPPEKWSVVKRDIL